MNTQRIDPKLLAVPAIARIVARCRGLGRRTMCTWTLDAVPPPQPAPPPAEKSRGIGSRPHREETFDWGTKDRCREIERDRHANFDPAEIEKSRRHPADRAFIVRRLKRR